jgi:MraZ protein
MAVDSGSKPKLLLGQDEATIDDKGRVLFSKKKRERLGEDFVMCLGDNGCLYAYPSDVWEPMAAEVLSHDRTNQGRQVYTRLVLGTAVDELNFDGQGRAVVPRMLREMAKLKDRIVLIGCGDRLEIWAEDELKKHDASPATYGRERADLINEARRQMRGDL